MKTIVLLSLMLIISAATFGQFSADDTVQSKSGRVDVGLVAMYAKVVNQTGAEITPHWKRTYKELTGQWTTAVCIGELCYDTTVSQGVFVNPMMPLDTTLVSCYLYPDQQTSGYSEVHVVIYDPSDSANSHIALEFSFSGWPLSVDPQPSPSVELYPNPATNQIMIDHPLVQPEAFQVFNQQGQLVWQIDALPGADKSVIQLAHLPVGTYWMQIIDRHGKSMSAMSFVKQ